MTREESRQLNFFDTIDYEKQKKAELAIDQLRRKFGRDVIKRACFLERKDGGIAPDNMAGGISREKLTVDYSKEEIL